MEELLKHAKQGDEVQLRGFFYPIEHDPGHWVLATEPNLKSCCLGANGLVHQQVHIQGDFPMDLAGRVVEIRGRLQRQEMMDGTGNSKFYYKIESPKVIEKGDGRTSLILIGVLMIIGALYLKRKWFRQKHGLR